MGSEGKGGILVGGGLIVVVFASIPFFLLANMSDSTPRAPLLSFAMLFLGIAAFLAASWWVALQRVQFETEAKRKNPQEPWLWRKEWTERVLYASPSSSAGMGLGIAFVGAFFVIFVTSFILDESKLSAKARAMVEFRYGISALLLLLAAYLVLRAYLHWRNTKRYSKAALHLTKVPLTAGDRFPSKIMLDPSLQFEGEIKVDLTCMFFRRWGAGTGRGVSELWRVRLPATQVGNEVRFESTVIPTDLPEAWSQSVFGGIVWTIALLGTVNGKEVLFYFELPIFKNAR